MSLAFIHNLIIAILLFSLSIYLMVFAYKYREENRYGFNSTILVVVLLAILAISLLLFEELIPYPINGAINVWLGVVFAAQGVYFLVMKYKYKEEGNKTNIDESTYAENGELKLKKEYMRKAFHLVVLLIVLCYFFLALIINDFVYRLYLNDPQLYYSIWSISDYPFIPSTANELQVMASWTFMFFISATIFLIIPDIFRIYNRKYSMFSGVYKMVIRKKELYTLGPQIYLTISCTFVFLLSLLGLFEPLVTLAGMMIAGFADAAAAIFGRKYGTHKFKTTLQKDEEKSYEGLIAGFLVSYIVALIFVGPIVAIFGAITFSVIDYLNPKIADNVLNPIFCTLVMSLPYVLIV
jgi:dolichol kinase